VTRRTALVRFLVSPCDIARQKGESLVIQRLSFRLLVKLSCLIVLVGGCAHTEQANVDPAMQVRQPQPDPGVKQRADEIAGKVEARAQRSEKAEGKQDLVKDEVKVTTDPSGNPVVEQKGEASWYGRYHHGRKMANGERFDQHDLTAAHPTLPLGTEARITNLENGKSVTVTINDRGPYAKGRDIDLSRGAAERLGLMKDGAVPVKIDAVVTPSPAQTAQR
jgi:rare lipoprotein A